jgi:hypothetical protein
MAAKFRILPDGRMFVPSRGQPPEPPEGYMTDPNNPFMFRPISPVTNKETTDRELYQHLYEDKMLNYGSAEHNRCPGVKFYEYYYKELLPPIFDFGCGRGDTVHYLRKHGFQATGADQVNLNNDMHVANIIEPMTLQIGSRTALCLDVFEHLVDSDLEGLIINMRMCDKQIISVHTGTAYEIGCKKDLHINKKSFEEWEFFLEENDLEVVRFYQLGKRRGLFFCK